VAKTSKIERDKQRRDMVARYAKKRAELKELIRDPKTDDEKRFEAVQKLAALPRNSSPVRVRNRCRLTGRSRAYYRKFGLSRIALRDLALRGELAGVRKSSW
jgi:small subunit ribosomal protein S14